MYNINVHDFLEVKVGELSKKPRVAVLMATFNGEKFIRKQIESIFNQKNVNVSLYVFDDGSSDGTLIEIENWVSNGYSVHLIPRLQIKLGASQSFFHLMRLNLSEKYVSFADQDDIWLDNHLIQAITFIEQVENGIVCSGRHLIDDVGSVFARAVGIQKPLSVKNAVVENVVYGNTIVLHKDTLNRISKNLPKNPVMHDSWLYLWGSCFGKLIYLNDITVLYRIHSKNHLGVRRSLNLFKILDNQRRFMRQNREFVNIFRDNGNKHVKAVETHINAFSGKSSMKKIKGVFGDTFYRQSALDSLFLRFLFLCFRV
jgi:rhamnosyltransferase